MTPNLLPDMPVSIEFPVWLNTTAIGFTIVTLCVAIRYLAKKSEATEAKLISELTRKQRQSGRKKSKIDKK
jgi:hypothetical protein